MIKSFFLTAMMLVGMASCESFPERDQRPRDFDQTYARSRGEMGAELADQARVSFEKGHLNQALRLAEMAHHFDEGQTQLIAEIRAAMSAQFTSAANDLLALEKFSAARARAQQAMDANPDDWNAQNLLEQINHQEANAFIRLARTHQTEGDLEKALLSLERAERIDPDNMDAKTLRAELQTADAANRLATLAASFDRHLADRRLIAAAAALEGMKSINAEESIVEAKEFQLLQLQSDSEQLRIDGMAALDAGNFELAIEKLQAAQGMNADFQLNPYITEATVGSERRVFLAAMESGKRLEALRSAKRLEALQSNEKMRELLPQLEDAVVLEAIREASRLQDSNDIAGARAILRAAIDAIDDPRLRSALEDLD